jgi:hypothetical protein
MIGARPAQPPPTAASTANRATARRLTSKPGLTRRDDGDPLNAVAIHRVGAVPTVPLLQLGSLRVLISSVATSRSFRLLSWE